MAWLFLLMPSALTGALCAFFVKRKWSVCLAGGLPVLGLFCALIYKVYFAPDADGGDGFWIIALLVGGSVAAFTSVMSFRAVRNLMDSSAR